MYRRILNELLNILSWSHFVASLFSSERSLSSPIRYRLWAVLIGTCCDFAICLNFIPACARRSTISRWSYGSFANALLNRLNSSLIMIHFSGLLELDATGLAASSPGLWRRWYARLTFRALFAVTWGRKP